MAGAAAAAMLAVEAIQLILSSFEANLKFGAYLCPLDSPIETITTTPFDYIIVGGGSAGSVLANRLSACTNKNVLLLEAGGCPPLESICTGYFPLQPQSAFDYNMLAVNDSYTGQNFKDGSYRLTMGKMLGGSSGIHHVMWSRGTPYDFAIWADAAGDSSWNYENLLQYFKKSETTSDEYILKENGTYCGTEGPINLKRQVSSENDGILEAFADLGYNIVNNSNADIGTDIVLHPLLAIGNDGIRQSGLNSYITPVKDRSNLYVLTGATVSKINFDDSNVATGVTFTYSNNSYTVTAKSEVILAAGAIVTPQLLMLSGVGPSDHLTEKGIPVISNLPVGDNLQDHLGAPLFFSLEDDNSPTPGSDPYAFPAPATCNYINLDDSSANYPNYQGINFVFPHEAAGLLQICTNAFKYTNPICDAISEVNTGKKVLMAVSNIVRPKSRGTIRLDTLDIQDQPVIKMGYFSENSDLVNLAKFLNHTAQLVNTDYFKSIGGKFNDLGLCSEHSRYSTEYWQCYALAMSSTMWHYCGTASLGSVVDTNGLVFGVSNLRVVDASIFPTIPGAKINAAVVAAAEKFADVIVSGLGNTCQSN